MACALPVVAAEATGATNLVRDRRNGHPRRSPCDLDGFAAALEAYARDPELRQRRHGEGGLAIARTMDWDRINAVAPPANLRSRDRQTRTVVAHDGSLTPLT